MITKKESYFLAQLWTYDNMTMALTCKEGEWEFQNFTWELPAIDTEGYIMESFNGYVLSVNSTEPGTRVALKQVDPNSTETQKWIIMPMRNREGFFTIELVIEDFLPFLPRLLTMSHNNQTNTTTTTIEGKRIIELLLLSFKRKKKTFCSYFSKIFENS